MKKESKEVHEGDLRAEYDFSKLSGGIRGKYADRYRSGTNLVHLDPDVAAVFKDDASVNRALRSLVDIAKSQVSADK